MTLLTISVLTSLQGTRFRVAAECGIHPNTHARALAGVGVSDTTRAKIGSFFELLLEELRAPFELAQWKGTVSK